MHYDLAMTLILAAVAPFLLAVYERQNSRLRDAGVPAWKRAAAALPQLWIVLSVALIAVKVWLAAPLIVAGLVMLYSEWTAVKRRAVTQGPLAQRVNELAGRRPLYIYPMRLWVLAGALWITPIPVILSERLIDRLSRREIDALAARQICPLRAASAVACLACVVGLSLIAWRTPVLLWVALPAGMAALVWLLRRSDRAADRAVLALTGHAEAFISAIAKAERVNREAGVRPPLLLAGAARRAQLLADQTGIGAKRLAHLLEADDAPPADRYPAPVTG